MKNQKPTPTDPNNPTIRKAAMADAIWMLARAAILLPLITPFWLLYAICAGAGNCAEFFEDLFNILSQRFRLAFAGPDTYAKTERAFEEVRELRSRVKWLESSGDELARHSTDQARDDWNQAKETKP